MTEDERRAEEQSEPDEQLDDLEPADDDAGELKGGGPRNQTAQTGGGPGD